MRSTSELSELAHARQMICVNELLTLADADISRLQSSHTLLLDAIECAVHKVVERERVAGRGLRGLEGFQVQRLTLQKKDNLVRRMLRQHTRSARRKT